MQKRLPKPMLKSPTTNVYDVALRLLTRREHSSRELKQKLLQRGFDSDLIDKTITTLIDQSLLSETRFVESYAQSRISKGYGPLRVSAELRERGIADQLINNYLENDREFWLAQAMQVHQKKFGGTPPKTLEEKAKQIRFLQHRGFDFEDINKVFERRA